MKDGFKSITIEPFNGYLDFQGPINSQEPNGNITLKGDIRLELTKTVKVKSAALKFKGNSRACHQNAIETVDISTPILPKLKTQLFSSTTSIGPGEVTLPWEIEILNIYPSSVMIKRLSISYKIELTISLGLNRTVTAEYPIILKRHLLPCLQVAPLVPPKLYTKTISTKFHYEINAPRIVCVAQGNIPMAIKLLTIGAQKRVHSIRTQLLQIELYRCGGIPKTDADMTKFKPHSLGQKPTGPISSKKTETSKYAKYTKRTASAIIHTLDEALPMSTTQPLLIRHPLDEYLTMGLESPLASIYHQLEITFQFGAKFEDIRAKIPILVASAGPDQSKLNRKIPTYCSSGNQQNQHHQVPTALYPFEKVSLVEPISVTDASRKDRVRQPTTTPTSNSSDGATMEEEEDKKEGYDDDDEDGDDEDRCVEEVDDLSRNNTESTTKNNNNHGPTGFLNTPSIIQSDTHPLRRAQSAVDLSTIASLDTENLDSQLPKAQKQPQRPQNTPGAPSLVFNKPIVAASTTEEGDILFSHAQSKRLLGNSISKASGMSPRPGSQVPHQWRRRSSSQPYLYTDHMANTKGHKRHHPNLTITPPSMITLRSLAHPPVKDVGVSESSSNSSSNNSSSSSNYEPQSRPTSPSFATAPGLPSFIPLHPHEARPVALLEESFILSPGSSVASPPLPLATSRTSLISTAKSSILDPDEEDILQHAMQSHYRRTPHSSSSLEHHYTYAKLPPIPTTTTTTLDLRKNRRHTTIYYADDTSDEDDGNDGDDDEDDDDDDDDFYVTSNSKTTLNNMVPLPPSITDSPLPPVPPITQDVDDEPMCLCPKHGIIVVARQ